jgi:hypothetical protein
MSIKISGNRKKLHQLQDDLESFVHVLVYTSLRYCRSNLDEEVLRNIFARAFGPYDCSGYKFYFYMDPEQWFKTQLEFIELGPLTDWVQKAMRHVEEWTRSPYAKMKTGPAASKELVELQFPYRAIYDIEDPIAISTPFRSHAALKNLWKDCLDSDWGSLNDTRAAHDNFSKNSMSVAQPQTGKKRPADGEIGRPASSKKVKSNSDGLEEIRSQRSEGGSSNRRSTRLQSANRLAPASKRGQ